MSIGYSQMPSWITTNSSNMVNTAKTGASTRKNNNSSMPKIEAAANKNINQSTSGFMREVFAADHTASAVSHNSGETKKDRKNTLHLPAVVDIDGVQVRTNNRTDEEVIQELAQKTRKSPMLVESELKRKYTSRFSGSLDMNA